ncbi:MAG: hypothetical protein AW07_00292 [Candidatus Accumulibacter sp. SK-11]|nr:MAG: hypothetical protein AW07_00292 [Candidatus Accumulibacter sp. SK-11]
MTPTKAGVNGSSAIHDLIGQIGDLRLRKPLAGEWKAASTGNGTCSNMSSSKNCPAESTLPRLTASSMSRQTSPSLLWMFLARGCGLH